MYADSAYYLCDFEGTSVPSESVNAALDYASELIDSATQYRIVDTGFTNLTAFQQAKIKKACCVLAEDVHAGGYLQAGASISGGFSLGDFTVQANPSQQSIQGVNVSSRAVSLLMATGLMYSGVRSWGF